MRISLIIPAYNEEAYLGACLDSVLRNAPGKFFEIIVVNNASTDRTREVALSRAGVRVVDEPEKGLTKARQRGLLEAKGDLLAYIDADTVLPPGWVEKVKRVFAERKDAVCLSGPYKYHDGPKFQRILMNALWRLAAPIAYRLAGYMALGGNFIARRDALIRVGGFNPSISFYGEDTDIARRLSKVGKVIFRMDFFIWSSSRRIAAEGIFKTNLTYALNFLWPALFGKPFTKKYKDVRLAPLPVKIK